MQEVTGSSPVSPTTTARRRVERDTRRRDGATREQGHRLRAPQSPTMAHHPRAAGEPARDPPDSAEREMRGTAARTRVEPREDRTSRPARMRGLLIPRADG